MLNGTKEAITVYSTKGQGLLEEIALLSMEKVVEFVKKYRDNGEQKDTCQLQILVDALYAYYEKDKYIVYIYDNDEILIQLLEFFSISDAPAFIVKAISEVYKVEFWDLWEKFRDVVEYSGADYSAGPDSGNRYSSLKETDIPMPETV